MIPYQLLVLYTYTQSAKYTKYQLIVDITPSPFLFLFSFCSYLSLPLLPLSLHRRLSLRPPRHELEARNILKGNNYRHISVFSHIFTIFHIECCLYVFIFSPSLPPSLSLSPSLSLPLSLSLSLSLFFLRQS